MAANGATATPEASDAIDAAKRREEMVRRIDAALAERWEAEHVEPAPKANDGEFMRRACLDLNGVIPRAWEVRDFLADDRVDKRAMLVNRLLKSPRYATHMATTWRNRIIPQEVDPTRMRQAVALQKWLRTRFAKNLRYDNLVGGLLLASGDDEFGPALYFQANDVAPDKMAASSAELFLGVQLNCAQCHDHPFAEWSQRDFWGLAAFFARTKSPNNTGMMQTAYRLVDGDSGDVKLPDSDEVVLPRFPRGEQAQDEQWQSRRMQLVAWMTSRDNEFFSRAAVNWAWSHLFGRGIVESLDDAEKNNADAQLLNELSDYFVASGFDLEELWRTLASTRAYHLSSRNDAPKTAGPELFARVLAKPLTPEQLYDSFTTLAPTPQMLAVGGANRDMGAALDEDPARADFVRRMRAPPGNATDYRAGTLQALQLMNGSFTANVAGADRTGVLGALGAPFLADEDRIEALFLATLARQPDSDERAACAEALREGKSTKERNAILSDILWALINSTEFAFNH